jgi:hypothetical protein
MKTYTLYKADNPNKKYKVYIKTQHGYKKIEFGANGMSDYTIHRDQERRQRYIKRHYKNENWTDSETAGFWSFWILWNKPTISESYKDTIKRFHLKPETI